MSKEFIESIFDLNKLKKEAAEVKAMFRDEEALRKWAIEQVIKSNIDRGVSRYTLKEADDLIAYVMGKERAKYFFTQDNSSHWYMIPVTLRAEWRELITKDCEKHDEIINEDFSKYRTGGGIDHVEFYID